MQTPLKREKNVNFFAMISLINVTLEDNRKKTCTLLNRNGVTPKMTCSGIDYFFLRILLRLSQLLENLQFRQMEIPFFLFKKRIFIMMHLSMN